MAINLDELLLEHGGLDMIGGELSIEILFDLGELEVLSENELEVAVGLGDLLDKEEGEVAYLIGVVAWVSRAYPWRARCC